MTIINSSCKRMALSTVVLLSAANTSQALIENGGDITIAVSNDWGSGYCADVNVTNVSGGTITSWSTVLNLGSATVNNMWGASLSGSTATPELQNASIAPNASVSFGFCANASGSNYQPSITSFSSDASSTGGGSGGGTGGGSGGGETGGGSGGGSGGETGGTAGLTCALGTIDKWDSGFVANNIIVKNEGTTTIANWSVTLAFKQVIQITGKWNATLSAVGTTVTASGESDKDLSPGESATFGFQGSHNAGSSFELPVCSEPAPGSGSGGGSGGGGEAGGYDPIQTGCNGYSTRFWDCCKPHCGWGANVPNGMFPTASCSINNNPLSDFTAGSACNSGGDAHTCYGLNPIKISDTLSFGYAATSSGDVCGRCFQLQFTGTSHNAPGDPGSAAMLGKTMIVQAINIGYDVSGGQFDILVPGGGVGAFNACSKQWGVTNDELGA